MLPVAEKEIIDEYHINIPLIGEWLSKKLGKYTVDYYEYKMDFGEMGYIQLTSNKPIRGENDEETGIKLGLMMDQINKSTSYNESGEVELKGYKLKYNNKLQSKTWTSKK